MFNHFYNNKGENKIILTNEFIRTPRTFGAFGYIRIVWIILLISIFSFTGCSLKFGGPKNGEMTISGQKILVEVVEDWPAIFKGLSGRESLADNQGMLFVFPKSDIYEFWMKDMKFSLDIIWINNDQIVEIWPNAPMPKNNSIPRYKPEKSANYVLEVNAGVAEGYGWKRGDKIIINYK